MPGEGSGPPRWLVLLVLGVAMLGCFATGVTWVVRQLYGGMEAELRRQDVHRLALHAAEASPEVAAQLGAPLTGGALRLGAHGTQGGEGRVDFVLEVRGPRGRGALDAQAAFDGKRWTLTRLRFVPEGAGAEVALPAGQSTEHRP